MLQSETGNEREPLHHHHTPLQSVPDADISYKLQGHHGVVSHTSDYSEAKRYFGLTD